MKNCNGLRVLIVGTYPPPFGGVATHIKALAPGLKKLGAEDVAVLSFNEGERIEYGDGFTVYRFTLKSELWRLANPANWQLCYRVFRLLRSYGVGWKMLLIESVKAVLIDDIARRHRSSVLSAYQCDLNMVLLPLSKVWGASRPIVLTVLGEIYEKSMGQFILDHAALFRDLITAPAAVISSSCHCANAYAQIGVSRTIETVFFGVELDRGALQEKRDSFRANHKYNKEDVVVFFMGRMNADMGLDVVLETAPELFDTEPTARLVIAGAKGILTQQAHRFAEQYPEKVFVIENVPFAQQHELYSAADILVAPSFNQRACMGVSIKEAMAALLPVIGGAGGGVPEAIVDGETGFLIPVGPTGTVDANAYLEAVRRLIREPDLRSQFGDAGRQRAEELFSVERTNKRMAEIFISASNCSQ
jgi:glycosyltransferase involved in cell wall biosynthesis